MNIKDYVEEIPDWPKKNISFKDISPLLSDPICFTYIIDTLYSRYKDFDFDKIVGIDARGFIFASALAYKLEKSFILARKKGKLPPPTLSKSYDLEYGKASLEIKKNLLKKKDKILIVDDVIATGGTFNATKELLEKTGAKVIESAFLLDIRHEISSSFKTESPIFSLAEY